MFFSVFIVQQRLYGGALLDGFLANADRSAIPVTFAVQDHHFKRGECISRIPVGKSGYRLDQIFLHNNTLRPETLRIIDGSVQ